MGQLHVKAAEERFALSLAQRQGWGKLFYTVGTCLIGLLMIIPFVWMLSSSLKRESDIFVYPIQWIPKVWQFSNFREVWQGSAPFGLFYINSILVTFWTVLIQVLTSTMAGYAFAKINFRGRSFWFLLYLATMIIPPQVTLIPKFILFNWLGLLNTHISIILPGAFSAFGVFMLRQFFVTLPSELSESARIDGANEFRIWSQIMMPLAKPAIASLIILAFVWTWNDYMTPLVFLRSKELYTIPLGLDYFMDDSGTEYSLIMAAAVSAVVPLIAVYFIGQKFFIESIAASGIKG
ncbi:carbohydrate ABC transporter membrane protein 2 (CUT1 family) [Hydrogenispora ethanolica]|uniref:Carbohydrate ABC transporter membrane protein 2 (CUT1 family) n=1 Tax=Hydrogenispora ethanolica TaxID=1082276 RepID=A0A4R1RZW9_HYDET|nr:carbohydrate ABC transporter permease [Hydrogenispora ethanolica]TCL72361.1 carbohydrate ABC transporter membrane protein 2 (CUT1 family) [Hydrogenispora ethanolica]